MQPFDQLIECGGGTCRQHQYAAIRLIAYVTAERKRSRTIRRARAEVHSLHATPDPDSSRCERN